VTERTRWVDGFPRGRVAVGNSCGDRDRFRERDRRRRSPLGYPHHRRPSIDEAVHLLVVDVDGDAEVGFEDALVAPRGGVVASAVRFGLHLDEPTGPSSSGLVKSDDDLGRIQDMGQVREARFAVAPPVVLRPHQARARVAQSPSEHRRPWSQTTDPAIQPLDQPGVAEAGQAAAANSTPAQQRRINTPIGPPNRPDSAPRTEDSSLTAAATTDWSGPSRISYVNLRAW